MLKLHGTILHILFIRILFFMLAMMKLELHGFTIQSYVWDSLYSRFFPPYYTKLPTYIPSLCLQYNLTLPSLSQLSRYVTFPFLSFYYHFLLWWNWNCVGLSYHVEIGYKYILTLPCFLHNSHGMFTFMFITHSFLANYACYVQIGIAWVLYSTILQSLPSYSTGFSFFMLAMLKLHWLNYNTILRSLHCACYR